MVDIHGISELYPGVPWLESAAPSSADRRRVMRQLNKGEALHDLRAYLVIDHLASGAHRAGPGALPVAEHAGPDERRAEG
jgi:hypothetical protein